MDFSELTTLSPAKVEEILFTDYEGLSEKEAQKRLIKYGENKIKFEETTWKHILFRQFKSPFVYLLFFAFILSFALGERLDALMILLFVGINAGLGFYQEWRSEKTVKLLKKYLIGKINVIRGGQEKLQDATQLVPGDLIVLEPGDIIPADVRFIETFNLSVDESVLTGESQPITKYGEALKAETDKIYKADNIGFSGTTISAGRAKAYVFSTGQETSYAKIVKITSGIERKSSFEDEIAKFSKFTLIVVVATLLFVIITSLAIKPNPSATELILFSIALAVSVIPEALPVVTTFSMSIGAFDLARKSVVVKRLTSINDLGAIEVLATDKTGTLTENKLKVEDMLGDDKDDLILFANLASFLRKTSKNQGNIAFDLALFNKLSRREKLKFESFERLIDLPFDSVRRRVGALVKNGNLKTLIVRGAPEEIIKMCKNVKYSSQILDWTRNKGKEGKRVLAVAVRVANKANLKNINNFECEMTFCGLISFADPIKQSAYEAISVAQKLGVAVKILTGDGPEVAGLVATEIGLIDSDDKVLTGEAFDKMSIAEKHNAVDKYHVFARIVPEQKYQIVSLLKEKYYVGFLGEGINDAPALKASDCAIVVAGASDIARETADIVLLKSDLKVILDGIEEGRKVFANTSKYITATMASNFGNFFAVAFISLTIDFLPMLPLQILLVNLLSDFPMIMVATDNVDEAAVKVPRKYNLKSFATSAILFGLISTVFDFVFFGTFYPRGEKVLQTSWFIGSILTELLFLFSIRTKSFFLKTKAPSKTLMVLTSLAIFLTISIPFTTLGASVFGFKRPQIGDLSIILIIVVVYLAVTESFKLLTVKFNKLN